MPKPTSPYWDDLTIFIGPSTSGSGGRKWRCRFCNLEANSTITRVLRHASKLGGKGIVKCPNVPQAVADKILRENSFLMQEAVGSQGGVSRVEGDDILLEPLDDEIASLVGSSSQQKRARPSDGDTPTPTSSHCGAPKQASLASSLGTLSWRKERMRIADIEIARTFIECNLSFNVARTPQWRRMVNAISQIGASDGYTGVSYRNLRTKALDDEMARINRSLDPIKEGWQKFGCSILSDGWSDVRRRGIINILVSSCLGTYFLRAIDAGKGGRRITGDWIFSHIRQAIIEVHFLFFKIKVYMLSKLQFFIIIDAS